MGSSHLQSLLNKYEEKKSYVRDPNFWKNKNLETKIERKREANRLRTLPRNPELANMSVMDLKKYLRKFSIFSEEDYRIELANRPHILNKKEGKELRRIKAKQKT